MPSIPFGVSSYERGEGDIADMPTVNLYAEQAQTEGIVLQSRPPIVDRAQNMGVGPVEALFKRDNVVSGVLLGVSDKKLYEGTALVGAISGDGPYKIDGNEVGVMIAGGAALSFYSGTAFNTVSVPDGAGVSDVFVGNSRFWMIRKDTGRLYFTPVLENTVDGLDFVTAESMPDKLLQGLWIDGMAILFGAESVEFWPGTTNQNAPIAPLQGRVIERGIKATGCATPLGSSFGWVTDQNQVCIQTEQNVVSNPGLEERIAQSESVRAFRFFIEGTEFMAVRLDGETQAFNTRTGTWSEFSSQGQDNFVPQCHAAGVFGSAIDGRTFEFGDDYTDLGGEFERRFRAGFVVNGGSQKMNKLSVRVNTGRTNTLTGDYIEPVMQMRHSRDAGATWGDWQSASLGQQGNYRDRVEWRNLGIASQPGALFEFRVTDPVAFRVSDVFVNEPSGGR